MTLIAQDRLVTRAAMFATVAHTGQKRKYTNEPYIVHPARVVKLVQEAPHTPEMLAATWLHDVVEDCGILLDEIDRLFGHRVSDLVEQVTDVSRPSDGNRAVRKALDREHLAKADGDGQTIKLADLIDNSDSILAHDPNFARVYLREKRDLLQVLMKGNKLLWDRAWDIVTHGLD